MGIGSLQFCRGRRSGLASPRYAALYSPAHCALRPVVRVQPAHAAAHSSTRMRAVKYLFFSAVPYRKSDALGRSTAVSRTSKEPLCSFIPLKNPLVQPDLSHRARRQSRTSEARNSPQLYVLSATPSTRSSHLILVTPASHTTPHLIWIFHPIYRRVTSIAYVKAYVSTCEEGFSEKKDGVRRSGSHGAICV